MLTLPSWRAGNELRLENIIIRAHHGRERPSLDINNKERNRIRGLMFNSVLCKLFEG